MRYIAYYRVSTKHQGQSGLGLEAQKGIAHGFLKSNDELVAEFVEVESGRRNNRTELNKAIELSKQESATLLIAKLDRLSRNASFIFQLRDSKVDFVAVDMPEMNTLTVGIVAVIAQHERELISQRTREALAQKKKRGEKMGTPENLTPAARLKGLVVRMENARNNSANRRASALIVTYRAQEMTYTDIANRLNESGFKSRKGNRYYPSSVRQLYIRETSV